MTPQVTATGIKDGDRAVLQALVDRRGGAVLAYCERACSPSLVVEAVSDAFARFRAAVIATEHPGDLHPEVALLSATRAAAAARSPRPPASPVPDPEAGLGRLLASTASVEIVPELLLRRADGRLSEAEEAVLEDLLDASPVARALEERFAAAEEAYRVASREPLPAPLAEQVVTAMAAAPGPIPVSTTPPAYDQHTMEVDALALPPAEAPTPAPAPAAPGFTPDLDEGSGFFPRRRKRKKAEKEAAEAAAAEPAVDAGPTFTPFFAPEPVAAPEPAPLAAETEEPGPTVEWQVPDESVDEQLTAEAEAADAEAELVAAEPDPEPEPEPEPEAEVEHVQSASGVVEETVEFDGLADEEEPVDLADPEPAPEPDPAPPPPATPKSVPSPTQAYAPAPARKRSRLPGKATLLPALAVVAIAAIGAMVASGVFGGNDPSPPLDTGIVPERAQQAIPEGEAASVVDDLRAASAEARRQRLADQRRDIAAGIVPPPDGADTGP